MRGGLCGKSSAKKLENILPPQRTSREAPQGDKRGIGGKAEAVQHLINVMDAEKKI